MISLSGCDKTHFFGGLFCLRKILGLGLQIDTFKPGHPSIPHTVVCMYKVNLWRHGTTQNVLHICLLVFPRSRLNCRKIDIETREQWRQKTHALNSFILPILRLKPCGEVAGGVIANLSSRFYPVQKHRVVGSVCGKIKGDW